MTLVRDVLVSLLERLRFAFTPNGRREFVTRDQVYVLFSVYSLLLLHKNKWFYASFIHGNRWGLFSAYFLFWEILKLSLTFAVCGKRSLRREVVGTTKNRRARSGHARGEGALWERASLARARSLFRPLLPSACFSTAKNERLKGERLKYRRISAWKTRQNNKVHKWHTSPRGLSSLLHVYI